MISNLEDLGEVTIIGGHNLEQDATKLDTINEEL